MDDKLVRAKVHTAVQQHCATSGVQPNPYLAQRVLAAARDEGVPVVKKMLYHTQYRQRSEAYH